MGWPHRRGFVPPSSGSSGPRHCLSNRVGSSCMTFHDVPCDLFMMFDARSSCMVFLLIHGKVQVAVFVSLFRRWLAWLSQCNGLAEPRRVICRWAFCRPSIQFV